MFVGSGSSEGVVITLDVVRGGDEQCKDTVNRVSYFHHSNNSDSGFLPLP